MNKRRFIEKRNEIIRKRNKRKLLENRIARLERNMNESRDPGELLLELAEEGTLSWEALARELIAGASTEVLNRTCALLDVCDFDPDDDDDYDDDDYDDDDYDDDDDDYWNESIRCRR